MSHSEMCPDGFKGNGILHQVVSRGGSMVMYREVCPEGGPK